jgi:carbon monoxide dehydrogenase subunit G
LNMALSFEYAFVIKAPADRVWAYLTDPYRVAPALPGASITEKIDDANYAGAITVKVGPVTARYRGKVRFDTVDAAGRTVHIVASGQDTSGRGGADMRMSSRLVEKATGETEVSLTSEVSVTGILAQFGRGMIQDVSNQMFQRFSEAVRAELEKPADPANSGGSANPANSASSASSPNSAISANSANSDTPAGPATVAVDPKPAAAPPIDVLSLGGQVVGRATLRAFRRPGFWIAAVAVVLAISWFWFR